MSPFVKLSLWGFGISLLGTLPLGTLNIAAMQVSVTQGLLQGVWFSFGVALVEVIYVRISLVGIHWIQQHSRLLRLMDWVAFVIVLALSISTFVAASNTVGNKNIILATGLPNFVLGFVMSALNPLQIPFWFGWSTVLFTKKILIPKPKYYNWYTTGIGAGTLAGLAVFVWGGRLLVSALNVHQQIINYVLGSVFLATAIIQLVKILRHKGLADTTVEKSAAMIKAGRNSS